MAGVVIIGAGPGIGTSVARRFAAAGLASARAQLAAEVTRRRDV